MTDRMNEDTAANVVVSTENVWKLGYSKKRPGLKYFFNIQTRESVWENEMTTSTYRAIGPAVHVEGYPEPKEPPVKHTVNNNISCTQLCTPNELTNNPNLQPNHILPQLPGCHTNMCATCNSVPSIDGINRNNETPVYNQALCSLPHSSHQFLYPPNTVIIHCDPKQHAYNLNNLNNMQNINRPSNTIPCNPRRPKFNMRLSYIQSGFTDLREILSAKKHSNEVIQNIDTDSEVDTIKSQEEPNKFGAKPKEPKKESKEISDELRTGEQGRSLKASDKEAKESNEKCNESMDKSKERIEESQTCCNNTLIKKTAEVEDFCDSDTEWLQENLKSVGSDLQLDVTPLRKLAPSNTKSNCWFILTDANVLLNHLDFVDYLVNSDKKCRLKVPNITMNTLEKSYTTNIKRNVQIRRALCFLKQQLDSTNSDLEDSDIINLSKKIVQDNYHVVILSNEKLVLDKNVNRNIHIFTINEIKKNLKRPDKLPIEDVVTMTSLTNETTAEILSPNKTQINNEPSETDVLLQKVKETDVECSNFNYDLNHRNRWYSLKNEGKAEVSVNSNSGIKKREIRLKRIILDTPLLNKRQSNDKRKFIWRKKRNIDCASSKPYIEEKKNVIDSNENCKSPEENNIDLVNEGQLKESKPSCEFGVELQEEYKELTDISPLSENKDTDSTKINKEQTKSNSSNKSTPKHVMFEVTNNDMEEYLTLKCDEWVSRFLQIMEEVLTQVLQTVVAYNYENMPPPWTVHEATECIKKMFITNIDVVDAASKLSELIFKTSNDKGKIKSNITPSEYMEMYSYGVYLVDSLQSILQSCEDLKIASESLSKLFSDINNYNQDSNTNTYNDSFNIDDSEILRDSLLDTSPIKATSVHESPKVVEKDSNGEIKKPHPPKKRQNHQKSKRSVRKSFRLNKKQRKQNIEYVPTSIPANNKTSFLTSLRLQKKQDEHVDNDINKPNPNPEPDNTKMNLQSNADSVIDSHSNNDMVINKDNEPKIIRKFTKCLEYESRFNNRYKNSKEARNEQYSSEAEYERENGYDEVVTDIDINNLLRKCSYECGNDKTNVDSIFKLFIGTFLNEIKVVFTSVHAFCLNARKDLLEMRQYGDVQKIAYILNAAEKFRAVIYDMRDSLLRISDREANNPGHIQAAFKAVGIQGLKDTHLSEYRIVIRKSIRQATLLLETADIITKAAKTAQTFTTT